MEILPTVITCSVQIVTCGLSYIFGRRTAKIDAKRAVLRERYNNFYVPFVRYLYKGFYIDRIRSGMPAQNRATMLELLSDNLEYLDVGTLRLYPCFYEAYLDMLEYEAGNSGFSKAPENFQHVVNQLALTILEETQRIALELSLPPLGQPLISDYRRNLSMLSKQVD